MSEKTDLLKALAELAVKLDRKPPADGTVAELKVLRTEWTAEVTALDDTGEDIVVDTGNTTTILSGPAGTGTSSGATLDDDVQVRLHSGEQLVRFVAVVTLHVNAVDDDGNLQPVVVAGTTARLPAKVFSALRDKRLVKGV